MASTASFVEYVLGQAAAAGLVSARKMFGEYAIYLDGKVVALVCDDRCFLKPTQATASLVADCPLQPPYPGAKPQPVIDELLDDAATIADLFRLTAAALPAPKPKPARKAAASPADSPKAKTKPARKAAAKTTNTPTPAPKPARKTPTTPRRRTP